MSTRYIISMDAGGCISIEEFTRKERRAYSLGIVYEQAKEMGLSPEATPPKLSRYHPDNTPTKEVRLPESTVRMIKRRIEWTLL